MSCILTDEEIFEPRMSLNVGNLSCSRCGLRLVDVVYYDGNPFCFECCAIVRRGDSIVIDFDAAKSKDAIINNLVLACESALLLRGITAAINDPLTLRGEKENYRRRYVEIERQIMAAIEGGK